MDSQGRVTTHTGMSSIDEAAAEELGIEDELGFDEDTMLGEA